MIGSLWASSLPSSPSSYSHRRWPMERPHALPARGQTVCHGTAGAVVFLRAAAVQVRASATYGRVTSQSHRFMTTTVLLNALLLVEFLFFHGQLDDRAIENKRL
jgi:hypothetical protein